MCITTQLKIRKQEIEIIYLYIINQKTKYMQQKLNVGTVEINNIRGKKLLYIILSSDLVEGSVIINIGEKNYKAIEGIMTGISPDIEIHKEKDSDIKNIDKAIKTGLKQLNNKYNK